MSQPKTYTPEAPGTVLCYDVREGGGAGQHVLEAILYVLLARR